MSRRLFCPGLFALLLPFPGACLNLVKKEAYDDWHRHLFYAGLAGTGHHSWGAVQTCKNICRKDSQSAVSLWYRVRCTECNATDIIHVENDAIHHIRTLKEQNKEKALWFLNNVPMTSIRAEGISPSQMSYPSGADFPHRVATGNVNDSHTARGHGKTSLFHPDLVHMARIFESARVDFRVLVMIRDAGSILRSTTEHRHYGERDEYSKILSDNAMVLHGQLMLLDPAFYMCFVPGKLADSAAGINKFIEFSHPDLPKQIVEHFAESCAALMPPGKANPDPDPAHIRLEDAMRLLEDVCTRNHRWLTHSLGVRQ